MAIKQGEKTIMGDFNKVVGKFFLIAIFMVAMFTFIVQTQDDNNAPSKIVDEEVFNSSLNKLILTTIRPSSFQLVLYKISPKTPKPMNLVIILNLFFTLLLILSAIQAYTF